VQEADDRRPVFRPSGHDPFSWATERTPGATAVLFLAIRTGRLAELLHQRALRPHQLDGAQLAVLVALASAGDDGAMAPRRLSALVAQTPSGITRTVKRLEREELVARAPDPDDGRSHLLRLTDAGRDAMATAMTDLVEQFDQHVESLGVADLRPLVATLEEASDLFERLPERIPVPRPRVGSEHNAPVDAEEPVGARIRRIRLEQGTSQRELAATVGIGAPHLSKLERDEEQPSEALLTRIADALGLDADDLLLQAGMVPRWMVEALASDPARATRMLRAWAPSAPGA
jgi:DNA-binding MarR family transcriptional regulator/DNA-binding XRE family transcriptional regulator